MAATDVESSSDESTLEQDSPPLLKYTRFDKKLPSTFFNRDSVSSVLLTDNFFAFGTQDGILHLTDKEFNALNTFKCHRSSIRKISTDAMQNKFFATASLDGTVVIGEYKNPSNTTTAYDFKRPVNSVVLDKDFEKNKSFVSGGTAGDVILSQRNWLGNRLDSIVNVQEHKKHKHDKDKFETQILDIFYINDVLIWVNDLGITFYDIYSKTVLLGIPFSNPQEKNNGKGEEIRPDLYKVNLHVSDSDRIIIGWYNKIWVLKVSAVSDQNKYENNNNNNDTSTSSNGSSSGFIPSKFFNEPKNIGSLLSNAASSLRATPDKKVELETNFVLDFLIVGISSFKDDQLLILGFESYSSGVSKKLTSPPELKIINMMDGTEELSNEIIVKNYESLSINDFHLSKYIDDSIPRYYLICSTDAICIQELTLEDHYEWYVKNKLFYKAWKLGEYTTNESEQFKIGLKYLDSVLNEDNDKHLAHMINEILNFKNLNELENEFLIKSICESWHKYISYFIEKNSLNLLLEFVPTDFDIGLGIYDLVLDSLLSTKEFDLFLKLLEQWPIALFDGKELANKLEQLIELHDANMLQYRRSVIYLYLKQEKYSKAIPHMLSINDINALDILLSTNILSQFMDDIVSIVLLPFDNNIEKLSELSLGEVELLLTKPINILIINRHTFDIKKLIDSFTYPNSLEIVNFLFLKELVKVESGLAVPYEDYMIDLYLKYDRLDLLPFLKDSSDYNIEDAVDKCTKREDTVEELIYLWGEMGETKKALSLIIDKLNDPNVAIEYVHNWDDLELWEFLIGYSLDKPKFVKALLNSDDKFGKTYVEVIKGISETLEVDGLPLLLKNILKDNSLSETVLKDLFKIIDDETRTYSNEYMTLSTKGKLFDIEGGN